MANQALPATTGGATSMAIVGSSAVGSEVTVKRRSSSIEPSSSQQIAP
jgi:hypothetical protein